MTNKTKTKIREKKDKLSTDWGRIVKHTIDMIEVAKRLDNPIFIDKLYEMHDYAEFQYKENKRI